MEQSTRKFKRQFRRQAKATIKLLKLLELLQNNCAPSREFTAAMLVVAHKAEQELEQQRTMLQSKLYEEKGKRENQKKVTKTHVR